MYTHDKLTDIVADQCLKEIYPNMKHIEIQESDEACIIYCVLKKFGIMNSNGFINLEMYRYILAYNITKKLFIFHNFLTYGLHS